MQLWRMAVWECEGEDKVIWRVKQGGRSEEDQEGRFVRRMERLLGR
jgi:hypothetical protein